MKFKTFRKFVKKLFTLKEASKGRYAYPKYMKLPLDDKAIFLESRMGAEIAGNIFYILKELNEDPQYKNHTFYITAKDEKAEGVKDILKEYGINRYTMVPYESREYYRVLATSKYLVNDVTFPRYFMKREGQVYLNTWHGTPWKCLGKKSEHDYYNFGNVQRNFMLADYLLYPNAYTRDHMTEDYIIDTLASRTRSFLAGYPRNSVFYKDSNTRKRMITEGIIQGHEKLFFYMPTWREEKAGKTSQRIAPHILMLKLIELDEKMQDDEILFVKLHPMATGAVNLSHFTHIKPFPAKYETYDFLSACDGLVTDYSSVFFDYENNGRKIILWTYDKEDYLGDRGVYFNIDKLPYPQVETVDDLLREMRTPKAYDSSWVKETFAAFDNKDAARTVLEVLFKGASSQAFEMKPVLIDKYAGKPMVVFYTSDLSKNGITSAYMNMLKSIDKKKYHVVSAFKINAVRKTPEVVKDFPEGLDYMPLWGGYNQTFCESILMALYFGKVLPTWMVEKTLKKVCRRNFQRLFPYVNMDTIVHFTGYEARTLMLFTQADAHKVCLVHNDMVQESKLRKNQHTGVLKYCYEHYDNLAVVNEALVEPTSTFLKSKDEVTKIVTVPNLITNEMIQANGNLPVEFHKETVSTMALDHLNEFLDSSRKIFISIGRYSPEKDHASMLKAFDRLHKEYPDTGLIIIGGHGNQYDNTLELRNSLASREDIVLIKGMRNPQPVLRKSDCFIMSSLYEGMPMVIFEADIQGLPVISTDISGPHYFLPRHGGTLTPTGEEGVYEGMKKFMEGKVLRMSIDYDQYNQNCLNALYSVIDGGKG